MQYEILVDSNYSVLQAAVKRYLDNGWELQGGVSCSISENEDFFAQAVIKKS